jgi:exodeoxyribonuclease VII small subunit
VGEKTKRQKSQEPQPTFEQSLERLEDIVHQLEDGKLGLSESLERYEEGVRHLKLCHQALESAERKIELLAGVDAEGNPVTEPFDDQDLTLDEKAASRTRRRSRPAQKRSDASDLENPPGALF